jgi:hypothetical protein
MGIWKGAPSGALFFFAIQSEIVGSDLAPVRAGRCHGAFGIGVAGMSE